MHLDHSLQALSRFPPSCPLPSIPALPSTSQDCVGTAECSRDHCLQALSRCPPSCVVGSRVTHYMYDGPFRMCVDVLRGQGLRSRGPRLLSTLPHPTWKRCELHVDSCQVCEWALVSRSEGRGRSSSNLTHRFLNKLPDFSGRRDHPPPSEEV